MEDNFSTMHVRLVVDEPHLCSSVGIEMNVETDTDGEFTRNYYYHEGSGKEVTNG